MSLCVRQKQVQTYGPTAPTMVFDGVKLMEAPFLMRPRTITISASNRKLTNPIFARHCVAFPRWHIMGLLRCKDWDILLVVLSYGIPSRWASTVVVLTSEAPVQ